MWPGSWCDSCHMHKCIVHKHDTLQNSPLNPGLLGQEKALLTVNNTVIISKFCFTDGKSN